MSDFNLKFVINADQTGYNYQIPYDKLLGTQDNKTIVVQKNKFT